MRKIDEVLAGNRSAAILGHIHPDGDCVGSCLGLYHYIKKAAPQMEADVYLEPFRKEFFLLPGAGDVHRDFQTEKIYDLCIVCDASDRGRLGAGAAILDRARVTVCVDHHKTNPGFTQITVLCPETGSTSEILFELMEESLIGRETAVCLYTGMAHDTGVFKYQSTTSRTMEIAGKLMDKGVPFTEIIDQTFYQKSFSQTRIMGKVLLDSQLCADGQCIYSSVSLAEMEALGATPMDLEGIVEQMRLVDGVEVSLFLYETAPGIFKASMRSKSRADVSRAAARFGGGGHARAAGCSLTGDREGVLAAMLSCVKEELAAHD